MHEVPHRIMWIGNQMPKVEVSGERCYVLGVDGDDRLVYCPTCRRRATGSSGDPIRRSGTSA
jgi:hypothetical protein